MLQNCLNSGFLLTFLGLDYRADSLNIYIVPLCPRNHWSKKLYNNKICCQNGRSDFLVSITEVQRCHNRTVNCFRNHHLKFKIIGQKEVTVIYVRKMDERPDPNDRKASLLIIFYTKYTLYIVIIITLKGHLKKIPRSKSSKFKSIPPRGVDPPFAIKIIFGCVHKPAIFSVSVRNSFSVIFVLLVSQLLYSEGCPVPFSYITKQVLRQTAYYKISKFSAISNFSLGL